MLLANLIERGATPALVRTMAFNEARLRTISENIANISTPGYRAKQLDTKAFQQALRKALTQRGADWKKPFVVNVRHEVSTNEDGTLSITPSTRPVENVLFHDGTNFSLERQMADLAETGLMHDMTSTLLRGSYEGIRKAIRGRM